MRSRSGRGTVREETRDRRLHSVERITVGQFFLCICSLNSSKTIFLVNCKFKRKLDVI